MFLTPPPIFPPSISWIAPTRSRLRGRIFSALRPISVSIRLLASTVDSPSLRRNDTESNIGLALSRPVMIASSILSVASRADIGGFASNPIRPRMKFRTARVNRCHAETGSAFGIISANVFWNFGLLHASAANSFKSVVP